MRNVLHGPSDLQVNNNKNHNNRNIRKYNSNMWFVSIILVLWINIKQLFLLCIICIVCVHNIFKIRNEQDLCVYVWVCCRCCVRNCCPISCWVVDCRYQGCILYHHHRIDIYAVLQFVWASALFYLSVGSVDHCYYILSAVWAIR